MREERAQHEIGPVAIHASYLINLCSQTESVRVNSTAAFRGEVERALALGAEYLVLHPGSWKGLTREEGAAAGRPSRSSARSGRSVGAWPWQGADFRIFDREHGWGRVFAGEFAGASGGVGGAPASARAGGGVSGYLPCACGGLRHRLARGYEETMRQVGATVGFDTVRVWHCNDAKAPRGRSSTGMNISGRERSARRRSGGCCTMGGLRIARLSRRRRWMRLG